MRSAFLNQELNREMLKVPNKNWKAIERRIAGFFGTVRTPLSGQNSRHTGSDTLHNNLFIEIKMRKRIPFLKTFKDTIKLSQKENKIPLVVFVEKGSQTPILMCRLHDLTEISKHKKETIELTTKCSICKKEVSVEKIVAWDHSINYAECCDCLRKKQEEKKHE